MSLVPMIVDAVGVVHLVGAGHIRHGRLDYALCEHSQNPQPLAEVQAHLPLPILHKAREENSVTCLACIAMEG